MLVYIGLVAGVSASLSEGGAPARTGTEWLEVNVG